MGSAPTERGLRAGTREAALTCLLLGSGAAALMHQTAWFRLLQPVLGAGVIPAAAVSAGALLGLAAGSALGGRWADRSGRPGWVFVGAEFLAAVACALIPAGVALLDALEDALTLPPGSQVGGSAEDLLLLLASVGLCAVAATPMGATLPAAVRALAPAPGSVGAVFRRLYGWNTVGAVVGVLLAVGWLLERLGNRQLVLVAALVQLAVALLAVGLLRRRRFEPVPAGERVRVRRALLWAAFLAGGAGLAVQIAWVRRLTPVVGNTTYAFATVLGTYLAALALGSLLLGPRRGRGPTRGPRVVLVAAAVPVALLPGALAWVGAWTAGAVHEGALSEARLLWIRTSAAGALLIPSTILGAAALPWLVRAAAPRAEASGRSAGRLLAMNTTGSAVLALVTAFVWLPGVGSAAVLRGAAGLYLLAATFVARGAHRAVLAAVAALLLLQPWLLPLRDDALFDTVGATFAPERFAPEDAERIFEREGRAATVVVRDREGRRELWVDSKIVASAQPTDRLHLALLGHLPMLLHPDPRRVAVVGLGTGITTRAVAGYAPEVLDVFELEPAVTEAAAAFEAEGGGLPEGARLHYGDGRHWLRRRPDGYDVITSDPIHPGVAGSAALYGEEYYRLLHARAAIVCQWLPLYQMDPADVRLVVRTFAAVFEAPYVFLAGPDAILIGAHEPLRIDEGRLRERLRAQSSAPLAGLGLRAPGRLLGLVVRGPEGTRSFGGDGVLNTDDRLLLEFRCGRSWYADFTAENARLLRIGRVSASTLLRDPPSGAFDAELQEARRFHDAMRAWLEWQNERARDEFADIAAALPENRLAATLRDDAELAAARDSFYSGMPEEAVARVRVLLASDDLEDRLRLDAAALLIEAGELAEGRAIAAQLARTHGWPRARRLAGER